MSKCKTERQRLIKNCDMLWSLAVKVRDRKCQVSGKDYSLQSHHICSRRYLRTRWLLENGITLNAGVHFFEKIDPERFRNTIIGVIGEEEYLRLQELGYAGGKSCKVSVEDLKETKEHLTKHLNTLERDFGKLI